MSTVDLCTHKLIYTISHTMRCQYVELHCNDKHDFNNYYYLYFCALDEDWVLMILVCVN
jgi:hypothetical protein